MTESASIALNRYFHIIKLASMKLVSMKLVSMKLVSMKVVSIETRQLKKLASNAVSNLAGLGCGKQIFS